MPTPRASTLHPRLLDTRKRNACACPLFSRLVAQRTATLNLRLAVCPAVKHRHGWVNFTADEGLAALSSTSRISTSRGTGLMVQCGPLGKYLTELGVRRLDFVSIDVEGVRRRPRFEPAGCDCDSLFALRSVRSGPSCRSF